MSKKRKATQRPVQGQGRLGHLAERKTTAQLASRFEVQHLTMISAWKRQLFGCAAALFDKNNKLRVVVAKQLLLWLAARAPRTMHGPMMLSKSVLVIGIC